MAYNNERQVNIHKMNLEIHEKIKPVIGYTCKITINYFLRALKRSEGAKAKDPEKRLT